MQSLATLNAAQTSRLMTVATQVNAPNPAREIALELPRQRNALLDYLFYDLRVLENHESADLAPHYAAEGAVLLVHPTDRAEITVFQDYDAFRASKHTGEAKALAVAGVGSSALGAAAFARNVADALDAPVLAVVSGYGLSDLLAEAMGGFFWFGAMNSVRHLFEMFDDVTRPHHSTFAFSAKPVLDQLRASFDVKTVIALLAGHDIDLIVGHSKGNLVISEALFALSETDAPRAAALAAKTRIVTIGAKIAMPRPFRDVIDVMGEHDGFGRMNSRPDIADDITVPGAGHHTNTELPGHVDVTNVVSQALRLPRR